MISTKSATHSTKIVHRFLRFFVLHFFCRKNPGRRPIVMFPRRAGETDNLLQTRRKALCIAKGFEQTKTIGNGAVGVQKKVKKQAASGGLRGRIPEKYQLFLMLFPFLVLVTIFSYLPLYGWRYAFYLYKPGFRLEDCTYVGLYWFQSIISNSYQVDEILRILRNTLGISGLGLLTSVAAPVFSIFLSQITVKWFRKSVQTLTTLPNFISWVLVYSVAFSMFNVNTGMVNQLLTRLGLVQAPINFLASGDHIWVKMTLWSLWKNLGWNAIMYLAAISGIDQQLYEAAEVDGAGRFRKIWHITVPGLMPTYLVLLIMQIANLINNGMEQYYVFQNAMNKNAIEVLDLYVYNISLLGNNFSFGTAISMLKSIVCVVLLLFANGMAKKIRGESIL